MADTDRLETSSSGHGKSWDGPGCPASTHPRPVRECDGHCRADAGIAGFVAGTCLFDAGCQKIDEANLRLYDNGHATCRLDLAKCILATRVLAAAPIRRRPGRLSPGGIHIPGNGRTVLDTFQNSRAHALLMIVRNGNELLHRTAEAVCVHSTGVPTCATTTVCRKDDTGILLRAHMSY